jgi:hypothetical protein
MMRLSKGALIWQRALLSACALVVIAVAAEVALVTTVWGSLRVQSTTTTQPFADRIVYAPAGSSLKSGDVVDLRKLTPQARFVWRSYDARFGQRFALPLMRDGTTTTAEVVAGRATYLGKPFLSAKSWPFWLGVAGYLWMTLFAALIAWRRPDSTETRVLALLLLATVSGTVLVDWRATLPAVDDALNAIGAVLGTVATGLLAAYLMLFRPVSPLRRTLAWLSYASVALASLIVITGAVGLWTLTLDPAGALLSGRAIQIAYNLLPFLLPTLCAVVTIVETRGSERTRILWATGSLGVLYAADCVAELAIIYIPSLNLNGIYLLANVAFFLAPIGLTYALIRRRLLDFGFILNRAAVFAIVSALVVGLFILFEWAVGGWLQHASHATSLLFSAGLALALGFFVHLIHGRVEHVVDNLFFRERHRDEQALRSFAHEAAYITDTDTLLGKALQTLQRYAEATSVETLLEAPDGTFRGVDEADRVLLELRAWHRPVHMHGLGSKIHGEIAFPMVSRGRLLGALVLGPKRSGDAYAPDEVDAIRHVAHGIAAALDVAASHAARHGENVELIEDVAERLAHAVARSLPDAIAAQLSTAPGPVTAVRPHTIARESRRNPPNAVPGD